MSVQASETELPPEVFPRRQRQCNRNTDLVGYDSISPDEGHLQKGTGQDVLLKPCVRHPAYNVLLH